MDSKIKNYRKLTKLLINKESQVQSLAEVFVLPKHFYILPAALQWFFMGVNVVDQHKEASYY